MSAHTPGPWGIEQTAAKNWIGPMRGDGKAWSIVVHMDRESLKPEVLARVDADARLIAAAPELLAALQLMVDNYVEAYGYEADDAPESVKCAFAALTKAHHD